MSVYLLALDGSNADDLASRRDNRRARLLGVAPQDQAEGVTDGVEVDAKRVARLELRLRGPDLQSVRFSLIEVINVEIEMKLLRHRSFGPGGRNVRVNFLKGDLALAVIEELDPRHVFGRKVFKRLNLQSREVSVETGERESVGTVNRGKGEINSSHGRKIANGRATRKRPVPHGLAAFSHFCSNYHHLVHGRRDDDLDHDMD
jgi:hypothetical protein